MECAADLVSGPVEAPDNGVSDATRFRRTSSIPIRCACGSGSISFSPGRIRRRMRREMPRGIDGRFDKLRGTTINPCGNRVPARAIRATPALKCRRTVRKSCMPATNTLGTLRVGADSIGRGVDRLQEEAVTDAALLCGAAVGVECMLRANRRARPDTSRDSGGTYAPIYRKDGRQDRSVVSRTRLHVDCDSWKLGRDGPVACSEGCGREGGWCHR